MTALRLALATFAVLAPGFVLARALGARSVSGAVVCGLGAVGAAMTVAFLAHSSLVLALWLLLAVGVAAIPFAIRADADDDGARLDAALAVVLATGIVFAAALWYVLPEPTGDALFHLARVRKLVAFEELSLSAVGEFADGGLHPGYAFPLWHAFLALVAHLAGLDPAVVVEREAVVLTPLAFAVVYEAGRELFRSAWLGAATLVATVALTALSQGSGGSFRSLALPATAGGRQFLVPAALAVAFAYLRAPSRRGLAVAALASLVLAVVHPTYALFVLLLFVGFLAASALAGLGETRRIATALVAMAAAAAVFLVWLAPVVRTTASYTPTEQQVTSRAHGWDRYPGQVEGTPERYRLAPKVVSRSGTVPVAALALLPLAALAARRRWSAYVLGTTLVALAVLLVPYVFPRFVDVVSLSQARRLAGFIPFAFALVGGAAVLARLLSYALVPVALAVGAAVQLLYPGDFGYRIAAGGPEWPVWTAVVGGTAALAVAALARSRPLVVERTDWVPFVAVAAFLVPTLVASSWERRDVAAELSPGLVQAVRAHVPERSVVLSDPETSYWLAAYAPVYVAVAPPTHVGDTEKNRPRERVRQWRRFLRTGEFEGRVEWLLLDRLRSGQTSCAPVVYRDVRYTLCRGLRRQ